MKLIHTSDWHLGGSLGEYSYADEQQKFLDWLLETMQTRECDVLVVSGDVFHYPAPSNTARQLYYDFLSQCNQQVYPDRVIVTAGNHDSPSGIEAPSTVLNTIDVTVVGEKPDPSDTDDYAVPIKTESGHTDAVVAAIPYLSESDLGVPVRTDDEADTLHDRYSDAFRSYHQQVLESVDSEYGEAPIVLTGHMTCFETPDRGDANEEGAEIHRTGTIGAMEPTVFPDGLNYVALGHIHRCQSISSDGRVWYSGSPTPTRVNETTTRHVLEVDLESDRDADPEVSKLEVPIWRRVEKLKGKPTDIKQQIESMTIERGLNPYLFIEVELEESQNPVQLQEEFQECIDEHFGESRPIIVECRTPFSEYEFEGVMDDFDDIDEMTPTDIFRERYRQQNPGAEEVPDDLVNYFETLVEESEQKTRESNQD